MNRPEITDEMVMAAAKAYYTHLGWDWEDLQDATRDHEENLAVIVSEFRIVLEAAFALIPAEPLGFCRKTQNCRLADGHEGGCPR